MKKDVEGVLLTDGLNRVFLHPVAQYPDGHGFHHQVDLVGVPFHGSIDASSYEGIKTFVSFHAQLIELYESLTGEARLPSSYKNLEVSLIGDGLGHVMVRVSALAGPSMGTRLSFDFTLDQTQLPAVISAVQKFLIMPASAAH